MPATNTGELLLEVGCEELPAWAVRKAAAELAEAIAARLAEQRLGHGTTVTLSTPRRLIVAVPGVPTEREPSSTRVRGPSLQAAYGPDGAPSKALEGFCRSKGVAVESVERDSEYVWAVVEEPGGPTSDALPGVLAGALGSLEFAKAMRWGSGKTRFVRPVRWILACFEGVHVPFEFAGVASGTLSRGHRFRAPEPFPAASIRELVEGLRERFVEPDPAERERRIRTQAADCSGGQAMLDDRLVDENVDITEWPECHVGEFRPEYLELPSAVLTTVIAKHERMFAVAGEHGAPDRRFVAVRNGGEPDAVRRGNEWVVNARLEDARFFWHEDAKSSMEAFLEATASIGFHAGLGNVRQRADRLAKLAREAALASGAGDDEADWAEAAGRMAKADLSTGLVGELDELQGAVGAIYLAREGAPAAVCEGVAGHYAVAASSGTAGARTALRVLVADQLDKLAGCLAAGAEPKGSRDPFGLRRAAGMLAEAAWALPAPFAGYGALFQSALAGYHQQGLVPECDEVASRAAPLLRQRYETLLPNVRLDIVAAASGDALDPRRVRFRASALTVLAGEPALVQQALRPVNIVEAAQKNGFDIATGMPSVEALGSPAGAELVTACERQAPLVAQAAQAESVEALLAALRPLGGPIDAYFESTMVMADEPAIRAHRLRAAQMAAELWLAAGDLRQIVFEG